MLLFACAAVACTNASSTDPPASNSAEAAETVSLPPVATRAPDAAGHPHLAVNVRTDSTIPEALGAGSFFVREACVVFSAEGEPGYFTPILPAGTQLSRGPGREPNGLTVRDGTIEFGKRYRVSGGEVVLAGASDVRLTGRIPDRCPRPTYLLGSVDVAS